MAANKYDGRLLSFTVNSQEFNADGTEVTFDREQTDQETVTFAELASGSTATWTIHVTAISDYSSGTFWSMLWENAGTEVNYVFKPYGNGTASPSKPHFTGKCKWDMKPPIGGQAGETWTYEQELEVTQGPTKKTA